MGAKTKTRALRAAPAPPAGPELNLRHIYGRSYFGAGGAGGAAWGHNCRPVEGSNGFVRGVTGATPVDPAQTAAVWAKGADGIGGGREWREGHVFHPGRGWEDVGFYEARRLGRQAADLPPWVKGDGLSPRL